LPLERASLRRQPTTTPRSLLRRAPLPIEGPASPRARTAAGTAMLRVRLVLSAVFRLIRGTRVTAARGGARQQVGRRVDSYRSPRGAPPGFSLGSHVPVAPPPVANGAWSPVLEEIDALPCPSAGRPSATGIDSDTAFKARLMCAGMSSGVPLSCAGASASEADRRTTHPGRRKNSSRSRRTSGRRSLRDVTASRGLASTNSVSSPCSTPDSRTKAGHFRL